MPELVCVDTDQLIPGGEAIMRQLCARMGIGLTVWRYPQGDMLALKKAEQQAKNQPDRAHVFVPQMEKQGGLMSSIMLHSGRLFDLVNPEANEITIEDIAHGLAHTCRYTGQCNWFYSVAQHSVLVSQVVAPEFAFAALMHDAAEAFIGDISRPLKSLLSEYRTLEEKVEQAIFKRFGLAWPVPEEVRKADDAVMLAEMKVLMPLGMSDPAREAGIVPARVQIWATSADWSKERFLDRYAELTGGIDHGER
jgi:uncharacterized protein